ncbi:peptidase [Brunnivagina elsteri]|uniref:Peptidase n=1 Tax=Brunnivagina elsteri CCALA 953 TaxID=987040 RepID=A0A2A2TAB4_9CYAN|nr:peptidase [Calothrix elsteri]PAX47089.1 peptidase [Calothrix elsteri CCALA 953]
MGKIKINFKILHLKPKILVTRLLKRLLVFLGIICCTGLLVYLTNLQSIAVYKSISRNIESSSPSLFNKIPEYQVNKNNLSTAKIHPLPENLQKWQDQNNNGDYFEQVKSTQVGYLIWSNFPIKIFIETPQNTNKNQAEAWVKVISQTVAEWNAYLPLQLVEKAELADITILRKAPPLQGNPPRARSAQTSYEIYTKNNFLNHKFTILLSPSQTGKYLVAAFRHELGHALGIWGHSPLPSDALYFSQVRNPPLISARDVNTLKKVYEQPTNLGWNVD